MDREHWIRQAALRRLRMTQRMEARQFDPDATYWMRRNQYALHQLAFCAGVLSPNDIRELESQR